MITFRTVVRSLLLLSVFLVAGTAGRAQSPEITATQMFSLGPGYSGGATVSVDPSLYWLVFPVYSYRFGLDATYPITPVVDATLGMGVERRAAGFRWFQETSVWEKRAVNYLTFSPGINISALHLGFDIGVPTGGTRTWRNGPDARANESDLDPDADSLNVLLEPCIGAVIPVYDNRIGWLGVTIMAGYALNNMSEHFMFSPGQEVDRVIRNTGTFSLRIGLTGQIGIPGTARE